MHFRAIHAGLLGRLQLHADLFSAKQFQLNNLSALLHGGDGVGIDLYMAIALGDLRLRQFRFRPRHALSQNQRSLGLPRPKPNGCANQYR